MVWTCPYLAGKLLRNRHVGRASPNSPDDSPGSQSPREEVTQATEQCLPGQASPKSRNFKWQEYECTDSGSFEASEAI